MCGILGGWTRSRLEGWQIEQALDKIAHRGPDGFGLFQDECVFLGMRRLAIIDIEGGKQPIFNEDRTVAVVLNGEIYNYKELASELKLKGHVFVSESDTEVLVHLYEEFGLEMLAKLRGMFAFSLWDLHKREIFIARDRFGKKPLYFAHTERDGFLFASEIKAIKALIKGMGASLTLREKSIYDYLSLGVIPQPCSIYNEVCSIPAGGWVVFDGRGLKGGKYWSWKPGQNNDGDISYSCLLEELRRIIAEAVSLRLRSDVPLGVFLSGGLDSSIVAYEAASKIGCRLRTFTIASNDKEFDESAVAKRTADFLGVNNTVIRLEIAPVEMLQYLVGHYDQPFADSSAIPSYAVSLAARSHVKVVLNGDGGDELFAGYRRHLAARYLGGIGSCKNNAIVNAISLLGEFASGRRSNLGYLSRVIAGLKERSGARYLSWTTDMLRDPDKKKYWLRAPQHSTEEWIESILPNGLTPLKTQLSGDVEILLLNALLVKMDMATMAASIEARSPFLDHILAEFAAGVSDRLLIRNGVGKALLRTAYSSILPREVIQGKKRGFEIPLVKWLQKDFHTILMDTVASSSSRVSRYLDREFLRKLLSREVMRDRNWGFIVYAILVLELWLRDEPVG